MNKIFRQLFIFVLIAVMLGVTLYFTPKTFADSLQKLPPNSKVTVYCRQTQLVATDVGNGYLVFCSLDGLSQCLAKCKDVDGISVRFDGTYVDFCNLQKSFRLHIRDTLQLDNLTVVCGFSDKLQGGVLLDGKKVNLQIAFDGTTVTVGSPLILDSF